MSMNTQRPCPFPKNRARLELAIGAAAVSLAAGGCKVGPDYQRPDASVNDAWMSQTMAATPADAASQRWWETFNDPALTALVQKAYAQNLSVKAAGLRVIEARARRGIAVGRFFAQSQEAFGSVANRQLSHNAAGSGTETSFSDAQIGLQAAWELDFWGKFRRGIEAADADLLATVADYDAIVVSMVSDVATNYILVRSLEERLVFAQANATLQAETLKLTQTKERAGAVSELDVSTARATLANTQALIPQLENDLQQTKLALCVLLGQTPSQLDADLAPASGADRRLPDVPAQIAAGIPADLLRRRPDVRVAEREAAAQSARIGQATADLYPSIAIAGSTGFATSTFEGVRHPSLGNIFDSDSFAGFIGLQVNWPVLNYGRIENNIRAQDALYEQSVAAYRATVLKAASDVEAGLSDFLRSKERSGFLAEAVDASKRSAELSLIQYRAGAVDFIRVNNAQTALVQQQDSLVVARAAIALGAVRTYRALGGGWEIRDGREYVDEATAKQMRERTDWGNVLNPDWDHGKDLGFKRPDGDSASGAQR